MSNNVYKEAYKKIVSAYLNVIVAIGVTLALVCFWIVYKIENPSLILSLLGIIFPISIFIFMRFVEQARVEMFKQIAKELNLTYIQDSSFTDPFLEKNNHLNNIRHVLTGTLDGEQVSHFMYSYTVKSGKSSVTYTYNVLMQTLPAYVPHILIHDEHETFTFGLPYPQSLHRPSNLRKVTLEGNFSKERDVYVEIEHEIEAYQLLAPDTMSFLLDHIQNVQIELVENRLFIYKIEELNTKSDILDFIHLCKTLNAKIKGTIPSIQKH